MKLLKAVESEVKAKRDRVEANLQILLENPVGIGEHCDIVAEVRGCIMQLADVEDELEVVSKYSKQYPEQI
jgi:hypothetical protein